MKHSARKWILNVTSSVLMMALQIPAFAQEKVNVNVNGQDVGSWFQRNWIWVVIGVAILLIVLLLSSSSSRRNSTTVIKDDFGNTKSVTRTEVREN